MFLNIKDNIITLQIKNFDSSKRKYDYSINHANIPIASSKDFIESEIIRYLNQFQLKSEIKNKRIESEATKENVNPDSFRGNVLLRFGFNPDVSRSQLEDLSVNKLKDQILILPNDGSVEALNSTIVSQDYSQPEFEDPLSGMFFSNHELSHALATPLVKTLLADFVTHFVGATNDKFEIQKSYSCLGESVVACLTKELVDTYFSQSNRNFNQTIGISKGLINYINKLLNQKNSA